MTASGDKSGSFLAQGHQHAGREQHAECLEAGVDLPQRHADQCCGCDSRTHQKRHCKIRSLDCVGLSDKTSQRSLLFLRCNGREAMGVLYVARSAKLARWASDVGLGRHIYKVGMTDEDPKTAAAEGWAGETDWTI